MKLHDLKPAPGSRTAKRRVGRGIAAGQGKTAGRGTKGQKARAGGKIPAWFEGGQTPLHQRIPKLRGFKNPFKIEYEVVNIGDIARLVEHGELESGDLPGATPSKQGAAPTTVNQEILRAAGLVRRLDRPMKVLGGGDGELSTALFVVADAFSASARSKIEGAGGTVSVLEVPSKKGRALGVTDEAPADDAAAEASAEAPVEASAEPSSEPASAEAPAGETAVEEAAKPARAKRGSAKPAADDMAADATADAAPADATPAAEPDAPAAAEDAPPKPRASRKPKTPKPDADA